MFYYIVELRSYNSIQMTFFHKWMMGIFFLENSLGTSSQASVVDGIQYFIESSQSLPTHRHICFWIILPEHSSVKLEKKVQFQKYKKTLFAFSKMAKNQFSDWKKTRFLVVLKFFLVQKLIFCTFEIALFFPSTVIRLNVNY